MASDRRALGLARFMGHQGWSSEEAAGVLKKMGFQVDSQELADEMNLGRSGSAVQPVSNGQIASLCKMRDELRLSANV